MINIIDVFIRSNPTNIHIDVTFVDRRKIKKLKKKNYVLVYNYFYILAIVKENNKKSIITSQYVITKNIVDTNLTFCVNKGVYRKNRYGTKTNTKNDFKKLPIPQLLTNEDFFINDYTEGFLIFKSKREFSKWKMKN